MEAAGVPIAYTDPAEVAAERGRGRSAATGSGSTRTTRAPTRSLQARTRSILARSNPDYLRPIPG